MGDTFKDKPKQERKDPPVKVNKLKKDEPIKIETGKESPFDMKKDYGLNPEYGEETDWQTYL